MADWDIDGFDDYATGDLSLWFASVIGSPTIASGGRNGGTRLVLANGERLVRALPAVQTELIAAFAVTISSLASQCHFWSFEDAAGHVLYLTAGTDGSVAAYRVSDNPAYRTGALPTVFPTLVGASAAGVIVAGEPIPLEIYLVLGEADGILEIRKSGVPVLVLSAIDTAPTDVTNISALCFANNSGVGITVAFDDFAVGTDWCGDTRIDSHKPIADVQDDWAPTSGETLYPMVDDATPDGDTTRISAIAADAKATFQFEALKNEEVSVISRQVAWVGKKSDAGDASVGGVLTHGGGDTDADGQALTTTDAGYKQMLAGCSEADFNADRYGLKKTV